MEMLKHISRIKIAILGILRILLARVLLRSWLCILSAFCLFLCCFILSLFFPLCGTRMGMGETRMQSTTRLKRQNKHPFHNPSFTELTFLDTMLQIYTKKKTKQKKNNLSNCG